MGAFSLMAAASRPSGTEVSGLLRWEWQRRMPSVCGRANDSGQARAVRSWRALLSTRRRLPGTGAALAASSSAEGPNHVFDIAVCASSWRCSGWQCVVVLPVSMPASGCRRCAAGGSVRSADAPAIHRQASSGKYSSCYSRAAERSGCCLACFAAACWQAGSPATPAPLGWRRGAGAFRSAAGSRRERSVDAQAGGRSQRRVRRDRPSSRHQRSPG